MALPTDEYSRRHERRDSLCRAQCPCRARFALRRAVRARLLFALVCCGGWYSIQRYRMLVTVLEVLYTSLPSNPHLALSSLCHMSKPPPPPSHTSHTANRRVYNVLVSAPSVAIPLPTPSSRRVRAPHSIRSNSAYTPPRPAVLSAPSSPPHSHRSLASSLRATFIATRPRRIWKPSTRFPCAYALPRPVLRV